MARIECFEDLIAWQKARALNKEIYRISKLGDFRKDFRLAAQIQSASVSVMGNIAEGFDRGRRAEFRQFLSVAKGSCGEVRSHLYAALDAGYIQHEEFEIIKAMGEETSRIIAGLRAKITGWEEQSNESSER